jgi:hypothetical protein
MLRLVPSQQAALGRLETALQRGVSWLALVAPSQSGKSTVLAHWPGALGANWLHLNARSIACPEDLVAACWQRWPSSHARIDELGWKTQLTQLQPPECSGLPMLVIDDAEQLDDVVLTVLSAMASGGYGAGWSILLVGALSLGVRLASACPESVSPTTVRLPPWDERDLQMACPEMMSLPETLRIERVTAHLESSIPQRLAALREPVPGTPLAAPEPMRKPFWRRHWVWFIVSAALVMAAIVVMTSTPSVVMESQRVPIPMTSQ